MPPAQVRTITPRHDTPLILASGSPARRQLLGRLGLPFTVCQTDIDESPLPDEEAQALVRRLALGKARAAATNNPDSLIIGCDQVCVHQGRVLGKPGSFEANCRQLSVFSNDWVHFHTGLVLLDSSNGDHQYRHVAFDVHFRSLTEEEIRYYVRSEQPWYCAGGFMAEGLGITLFQSMQGQDFHALIGLPLIALTDMLRESELNPLMPAACAGPESRTRLYPDRR